MTAMSTDDRTPETATADLSEAASRNTLALNPLVGIRGQDLVDSAGILFKAVMNEPKVATEQWLSFVGELGSIAAPDHVLSFDVVKASSGAEADDDVGEDVSACHRQRDVHHLRAYVQEKTDGELSGENEALQPRLPRTACAEPR